MVPCMPTKQWKKDIFHDITLLNFLQEFDIHLLKVINAVYLTFFQEVVLTLAVSI